MRIWLVDYDGKKENLALMRLSAYHKALGDSVMLKHGDAWPELFDTPDRVYISCLFRWNRDAALRLYDAWADIAEIGGTGVDIALRLPPEVEQCEPDYALYGCDNAIGFISRGCIRRCPWCVVPEKEGKLHRVATAAEIVGNRQEAVFLDNNFLALPDYQRDLEWLAEQQTVIDFNQGLDARLVTEETARLLARCKWAFGPRFAIDSMGQAEASQRTIELLDKAGLPASRISFYVLIGFAGLESDVSRLLLVHEWGANAFPMGYKDLETGEEPARGWNRAMYRKYRRLITRLPQAKGVWDDFRREVSAI